MKKLPANESLSSHSPSCYHRLAVYPPIEMHEMTFVQLVKDNPAWAGVFASTCFAFVTVCVITCQVCVMIWQGHNSERHERTQNRLLRLQFEHQWLQHLNGEREQILKLARELYLAVTSLNPQRSRSDPQTWSEVQDRVFELDGRLNRLDIAVYSGQYDSWFFSLNGYVDAVLKIILDDSKQSQPPTRTIPLPETLKALTDANKQYNPSKIFVDLDAAIRMEFFDFKTKWDAETSA
jgi:hypothetical protein